MRMQRWIAAWFMACASAQAPAAADYPPLPTAVSSFGAAVADGYLYVYGGHSGKTHSYSTESAIGKFHRLELADPNTWEELPAGPACQGLALVAHGGKVIRVGGMQPQNAPGEKSNNRSLASCSRFDPATKKWEELPELPAGRSSHDAVVVGDQLIVVGGWNMGGQGGRNEWHDTALVLDLGKQPLQWTTVPQPFKRRALTAAAHDGKVFIIGGMTSSAGVQRVVNIFDPTTSTWTTGPELPGPDRNGFSPAAAVAGERLYVSLGDGQVIRLDTAGKSWEPIGKLQQPRIVHRVVPAGDERLVALGGASRGGNVAKTETLSLRNANALAP